MTRQVVDAILSMSEYNRFSKGIFGWVGYETKWIEFENVQKLKSAGAKIIKIKSLKNLTSEEKNSGYDYQQYINTFIDDLKSEVYN